MTDEVCDQCENSVIRTTVAPAEGGKLATLNSKQFYFKNNQPIP